MMVLEPQSRPVRALRAGVFALASAGLGVEAHRLGGGITPPWWLAALAAAGLFAVAWTCTGAQRRLPVISVLVLVTQTVMHVGLSVLGAMSMPARMTGSDQSLLSMVLCRHPGGALTAAQIAQARSTLAALHVTSRPAGHAAPMSMASMMTPSMAWMLGAHIAAAGVMAWWLARGERAVWRCARHVVETVQAIAAGLPGAGAPACAAPVLPSAAALSSRWLVLAASGRAPPASWSSAFTPVLA